MWTRGGVLLCVHPLGASTPSPRAAIALTVLSRYVVLLPLEAGEDLPPRRDAERVRRADTASTLRGELPAASMELRDAPSRSEPDSDGRDESRRGRIRSRVGTSVSGERSGERSTSSTAIDVFHCASTVALCGGLLSHLASRESGQGQGTGEGVGIAVLEEMFRALSASERARADERHFELAQHTLLRRRRPSLAGGPEGDPEGGPEGVVQRLCRQLQAANRTAMRARVAGSIARLLLRPKRTRNAAGAKVSFFLFTVKFYTNRAHNLTRPP